MRVSHWILGLGLAGLTATGCARNRGATDVAAEEGAIVQVENDNVFNMRVSVIRAPSGALYRLGTAVGMTTTPMRIPRSLLNGVSDVTFAIVPLSGGHAQFTRTITVSPGDLLILRIPPI